MVRGVVTLPSGTGKDVKVAVFARGDNAEKALAAGADKVGAEDLLEDMLAGNLDYGRVIATPDMMGIVGRLGKVLGPKGLMPNPKLGTVTPNVADAVKAAKGGQIEFRVEKAGIIHGGVGKMSFSNEALRANFDAFVDAIIKAKPAGSQGNLRQEIVHFFVHGSRPQAGSRLRHGRRVSIARVSLLKFPRDFSGVPEVPRTSVYLSEIAGAGAQAPA